MLGLINGNIYVSFKPLKKVEALAIAYGRVIAIGDNDYVRRVVHELGGEVVDVGGRTVIPGFIDAHLHLDGVALTLKSLDLRGTQSINELKSKLKDFVDRNPDLEVIYGRGWDQELFIEGRWPTRYDIDDVVDDKPVILIRVCGHAALLNTRAMEDLDLLRSKSKDVVRDENGIPTGIVKESIIDMISSYVKGKLVKEYDKYIHDAINYLLSQGITTIGYVSADIKTVNSLLRLTREGKTLPRIYAYLDLSDFEKFLSFMSSPIYSDYVSVVGVKVFLDGSLGARTALLTKPYNDDPQNSGQELISVNDLTKLMDKAFSNGFQVAAHAIGDKAIDNAIVAYEKVRSSIKRGDIHFRIEHASVIRPDQIRKLRELDVAVTIQPRFVISDWWVVRRVGIERVKWVYPFKTMKNEGITIGLSTDAPVEPSNPWETVYAAVTRGSLEDIELSKYTTYEALSINEALHLYTYGSARVLNVKDLGKLLPGYKADFVVLSNDPLVTKPKELRRIKVLEVWIGGSRVK
ncbi:MAG: amidohydrolase [Desulfurococcales archaeon ex4484_42]|nr:MAG: amidohydrolase [Desulfurococcales archaeon ex4484_42]